MSTRFSLCSPTLSSTSEKALGTRMPCHWVLLCLRSERVEENPGNKFSCSLAKYSLFCRHLSYRNTYGQQKKFNLFCNIAANELKRDGAFYHPVSNLTVGLLPVALVQTSDWIKLRGSHARRELRHWLPNKFAVGR